jgi:hypothetical protein
MGKCTHSPSKNPTPFVVNGTTLSPSSLSQLMFDRLLSGAGGGGGGGGGGG